MHQLHLNRLLQHTVALLSSKTGGASRKALQRALRVVGTASEVRERVFVRQISRGRSRHKDTPYTQRARPRSVSPSIWRQRRDRYAEARARSVSPAAQRVGGGFKYASRSSRQTAPVDRANAAAHQLGGNLGRRAVSGRPRRLLPQRTGTLTPILHLKCEALPLDAAKVVAGVLATLARQDVAMAQLLRTGGQVPPPVPADTPAHAALSYLRQFMLPHPDAGAVAAMLEQLGTGSGIGEQTPRASKPTSPLDGEVVVREGHLESGAATEANGNSRHEDRQLVHSLASHLKKLAASMPAEPQGHDVQTQAPQAESPRLPLPQQDSTSQPLCAPALATSATSPTVAAAAAGTSTQESAASARESLKQTDEDARDSATPTPSDVKKPPSKVKRLKSALARRTSQLQLLLDQVSGVGEALRSFHAATAQAQGGKYQSSMPNSEEAGRALEQEDHAAHVGGQQGLARRSTGMAPSQARLGGWHTLLREAATALNVAARDAQNRAKEQAHKQRRKMSARRTGMAAGVRASEASSQKVSALQEELAASQASAASLLTQLDSARRLAKARKTALDALKSSIQSTCASTEAPQAPQMAIRSDSQGSVPAKPRESGMRRTPASAAGPSLFDRLSTPRCRSSALTPASGSKGPRTSSGGKTGAKATRAQESPSAETLRELESTVSSLSAAESSLSRRVEELSASLHSVQAEADMSAGLVSDLAASLFDKLCEQVKANSDVAQKLSEGGDMAKTWAGYTSRAAELQGALQQHLAQRKPATLRPQSVSHLVAAVLSDTAQVSHAAGMAQHHEQSSAASIAAAALADVGLKHGLSQRHPALWSPAAPSPPAFQAAPLPHATELAPPRADSSDLRGLGGPGLPGASLAELVAGIGLSSSSEDSGQGFSQLASAAQGPASVATMETV